MIAPDRPFRVHREGAALVLVLDTPGSSVNVFDPRAAAQLGEVLAGLPGSDVRALVIRSGKPGSFVNGAGLLYASAMKSRRQALTVSAPVRAVYDALAAAPVPTLAVVEGNCYGCGLELALCCRHRIGRDSYDTHFRMTEVCDYRFVPLFGGTWRLPSRVGREAALALLLDGERWSAAKARRAGLLDAVASAARLEALVARTVKRLVSGRASSTSAPPWRRRRARAEAAPPRRALFDACVELVDASSESDVARKRELSAFARTVVAPGAKRAMSFFFVRHMARAAGLGSAAQKESRR